MLHYRDVTLFLLHSLFRKVYIIPLLFPAAVPEMLCMSFVQNMEVFPGYDEDSFGYHLYDGEDELDCELVRGGSAASEEEEEEEEGVKHTGSMRHQGVLGKFR